MARVFVSHSSRDNAAAAELKAWLDEQGFAPAFLDFDEHSGIPPGADWERTLYEQIQRCQALLILQTPNWSASRWCFAEFTQARALGKPIFQVVQTDEAVAEKPIAADLQRLDLRHDRRAGLEQLRRELERIALQDQGGFPWPPPSDPSRSPFPGLMVFEAEDAPVFFGRDNDWRVVIERLNTRRVQGGPQLLVIQGSSGSGKSSLLRAGVLPRLRRAGRQWLVLPMLRPQARPLESLAQTLALALQSHEAWRELYQQLLTTTAAPALAGLVTGWAADLRLAAGAPEAQLLLPIDQAEELFTVAEAAERDRFVAVLAASLQPALPLQAVMTIRADAMGSLQSLPDLVNSLDTLPLGPLSIERYREIIEGPARVAGLMVEPAFVERAIHDTGTEDALPLLAFALQQIHDRYGADGVLSLSGYQALGDAAAGLSPLENAVKQAADGVLRTQRPDEASLKALREAFVPAMVRLSEQGGYARRAAGWDSLPQAARSLLEALVTARLLVHRQSEGNPSTVEVAHEALLRVWPLLRGWLDESRDFLLGCQQLEQDLTQWQAASPADRPRALLSGLKLARSRAWLAERGDQLRPELRTFIQTSQQSAVRQRRILQGSAAVAFSAIISATGLTFLQLQRARAAQAAQFEATHRALITSDPFLSVVYGLAAARPFLNGNKSWEQAQLSQSLEQAVMANMARSAPIATGQGGIRCLLELKNGELVSGGKDGSILYWRDGNPEGDGELIATNQGEVTSLLGLKNGELISGGSDGTLRRWRDGKPVSNENLIATGQGAVLSLIELKDGVIISGGSDGTLRRWRDGKPVGDGRPIVTGQRALSALIELRNGDLVSGSIDGSLQRWRGGMLVRNGKPIATGQGEIDSLVELKNGELISSGSDGTLRRWRDGTPVGDGRRVATGQMRVWSLVELSSGDLISAGSDGTLRRWRNGKPVGDGTKITTGQDVVWSLIRKKNGDLVSGARDGSLRRWQAEKTDSISKPIDLEQGIAWRLILTKNGKLISAGEDGSLRQWRVGRGLSLEMTIATGQMWATSLIELKNGELISGGADGSLRRWRDGKPVGDGKPVPTGQGAVRSLLELRSGELISGGEDGTYRRWLDGRPVGDGKPIKTRQGAVWRLVELENGELVTGGKDGTLRRWQDGKPLGDGRPIPTEQGALLILVQLRNGELISGGIDGSLRRWRDGKPVSDGSLFATRQGAVMSLIELNNGELVSGGSDGSLQRWRDGKKVGDGRPIATGQGEILNLVQLRNGILISSGLDGTLRRWDLSMVTQSACRQIDLDSISIDAGLAQVVQAAQATCRDILRRI